MHQYALFVLVLAILWHSLSACSLKEIREFLMRQLFWLPLLAAEGGIASATSRKLPSPLKEDAWNVRVTICQMVDRAAKGDF